MKPSNRVPSLALGATLAVVLSACGSGADEPVSDAPTPRQGGVTVGETSTGTDDTDDTTDTDDSDDTTDTDDTDSDDTETGEAGSADTRAPTTPNDGEISSGTGTGAASDAAAVNAAAQVAITTAEEEADGTAYELDDSDDDGTWEVDVAVDDESMEVTTSADGTELIGTEEITLDTAEDDDVEVYVDVMTGEVGTGD